jgi:hypothetical protein
VVAELAAEPLINADSLAHGNLSRDIDIAITPFGMRPVFRLCLTEQDLYTFHGDLSGRRVAGLLLHRLVTFLPGCGNLSA